MSLLLAFWKVKITKLAIFEPVSGTEQNGLSPIILVTNPKDMFSGKKAQFKEWNIEPDQPLNSMPYSTILQLYRQIHIKVYLILHAWRWLSTNYILWMLKDAWIVRTMMINSRTLWTSWRLTFKVHPMLQSGIPMSCWKRQHSATSEAQASDPWFRYMLQHIHTHTLRVDECLTLIALVQVSFKALRQVYSTS